MKNAARILTLSILLASLIVLFIPATAQEDDGGVIVLGIGGDAADFDFSPGQLTCGNSNCDTIQDLTYIGLLGIDPETAWFAPNQPNALAKDWEFSDDNRVLKIHLRDDMFWSDGTPITSADVMMFNELKTNAEFNPDEQVLINSIYEGVEAPDDYTIVVTFHQGNCDVLHHLEFWEVYPAHIYRELIDEVGYAELKNHEWFDNPTVFSGAFVYEGIAEDGTVSLRPNEYYPDPVTASRFEQRLYNGIGLEQFLSSEINVLKTVPREQYAAFREAAEAGELQILEYPSDAFGGMALNWADPTNPQPALDENGNRIEQGLHPIFGDKLTRQAIARAIDVDVLIEQAANGAGVRLKSNITENSWAFNYDLPLIPYEPNVALSMLAEAGWLPENSILPASEDNKLLCQDCLYAREIDSSFNGSSLEFELLFNEESGARKIMASLIQEQLAQIGITVHVVSMPFEDVVDEAFSQTFDAVLVNLGGLVYPHDPSSWRWFSPAIDVPDGGFNFTSFYHEGYFALEETAATISGCGLTERAEIYRQMQAIMQDELPFIFLYTGTRMYAAKNEVEGFAPYANNLWWNIDTWLVHESD